MLEHAKTVLQKVSFDKLLFKKELHKFIKWMSHDELYILRAWCVVTFAGRYDEVILDAFNKVA